MSKTIIKKEMLFVLKLFMITILIIFGIAIINSKFIENKFKDDSKNKLEVLEISMNLKIQEIYKDMCSLSNLLEVKNIKRDISSYYNIDESVVTRSALKTALEQSIYNEFEKYGKYSDYIDCICLATEEGGYLSWPEVKTISNYDPRNEAWYQIGILTGEKISQTSPYLDLITNEKVISNVRTIYNKDNTIGAVLRVDIDFNYLTDFFKQIKLSESEHIIVIHKSGYIIVDSGDTQNGGKKIEEIYPELSNRFVLGDIYNINLESKEHLLTVDFWDDFNWQIYYIADKQLFKEKVLDRNQYYYFIFIFGILSTVILVIIYLYLYKKRLENQFSIKLMENQKLVEELNEKDKIFRDNEEKYKNLVNNIPGIVFRCEPFPPWVMLSISNEVYSITGYEAVEFLKESYSMVWNNIIVKEDRQRVNTMEEAKDTGIYTVEYRIIHKNGETKWVMERGRRVKDSSGNVFIDGVIFELKGKN